MANKDENMLTWILAVRTFWLGSSNQGWNFKWNGGVFTEVKVKIIDKGNLLYLKDKVKIRVMSWYR